MLENSDYIQSEQDARRSKTYRRQLWLLGVVHFMFWLDAFLLYLLSYRDPQYVIPTIIVGVGVMISWIPYKSCPISVWKNDLRTRLNLQKEKFSMFFKYLNWLVRGRLPRAFTIYAIVASIFLRLVA